MTLRLEPAPRPGERLGPRPLALHVLQAQLAWARQRPDLLAFLQGVQAYRAHGYRRPPPAAAVVWQAGSTRLWDYGPADGWPILAVPSMINRGYVLDLTPETSLLRPLKALGLRPLLLDWGEARPEERRWPLARYIVARIEAALGWLGQTSGRRPILLGYCMGGLLAAAAAVRQPDQVAGLALLATPWDFHAGQWPPALLASAAQALEQVAGGLGGLPVDLLQSWFASLEPLQVPRKFARFAQLDPAGPAATAFVALEDWLNDGVPLGAGVASSCLRDWYAENRPARGCWDVDGVPIRPAGLTMPCLVAIPTEDRIVPPESARALARQLPAPQLVEPMGGHLGMIVGQRASRTLQTALHGWLRQIAALQR